MNGLTSILHRGIKNPHTSIAGIVWLLCRLGVVWMPQYKAQFEATESVAIAYGLFLAGDANQSAPADSSGQTAAEPVKRPTP